MHFKIMATAWFQIVFNPHVAFRQQTKIDKKEE